MARFEVRTPITTREPAIAVDAGLPVGRHRFRLEVIDGAGLRSAPDEIVFEVQRIIVDPGPVVVNPGPVINPGPIVRPPIIRSPEQPPASPRPRSRTPGAHGAPATERSGAQRPPRATEPGSGAEPRQKREKP